MGEKVGNVGLPDWAPTATMFIIKMREALESSYVSRHLHKWIDLIFGVSQRGYKAQISQNLF